jgi:Ubiquitin carboxyl-terminal hydrolase.
MNSYVQALFMTKIFRYRVLSLQLTNRPLMNGSTEPNNNNNNPQSPTTVNIGSNNITEIQEENKSEPQQKAQAQLNLHMDRKKLLYLFQTQKLFAYLHQSEREFVNPSFFRAVLPDPFSTSYAQQDSSEFGSRYLDQLESCLRITEDKVV